MAGAATAFLRANKRAAKRLKPYVPQARTDLHREYTRVVAEHVNALPPGATVVDVGGGRKCAFARYRNPASGVRVVAVDVSAEELALNADVDLTVVADVTERLPFGDNEVDLVVSRSVIEHLRRPQAFFDEAARVLKPGGLTIHVVPSRFAPFAIANQILSRRISSRLLRMLIPGSEGVLGFPAFYEQTYPSAFRRMLARSRLDVIELRVGYYQADYFNFFVPLFVLSAAYELIVSTLRLENLAANMLVLARKP
jgi:ubiquinone/menaquinone biosynthesis C-methylase UbiE